MTNDEIEAIMGGEGGQGAPAPAGNAGGADPAAIPGGQEGTGPSGAGMSLLYDLPLPVSVELGRTRLPVQEILALGRGSVVQLDRLAGEPVDLYVGDRKFAQGEVVVLGEQFGVRITRILPGSRALAGTVG